MIPKSSLKRIGLDRLLRNYKNIRKSDISAMNNSNIKHNYLYNLAYQILIIITPLITTPYISRVLGADGIGSYSYSYSIATYFYLFAVLGTSTYAQREIAFCQEDIEKRSKLFYEIESLRLLTSGVALIGYLILVINFKDATLRSLLVVQGLYIFSVAIDISWFYQGVENFKLIVLRNTFVKIINIFLVFIFIKRPTDLVLYGVILLGVPIIGYISMWLYLPKYIVKCAYKDLRPFSHFPKTCQLFIPTIAISIYGVLDKTMIGIITDGRYENGYYEQAEKISKLTLAIVTSLSTVMIPRISNLFKNNEYKIIRDYMYISYHIVMVLALPICVGLISVAPIFVPVFFGDGYHGAIPVLQVLSFLVVAIGINKITGEQFLIATNRHNVYTVSVTFGAIVNLVCNLFAIPRFGAVGAAFASVIAESGIAIFQLVYVCAILKFLELKNILMPLWKSLISVIIMFFITCAVKYMLHEATVINNIIVVFIGALVYIVTMFLLKDSIFEKFLLRIKDKLKRGDSNV